MIFTSCRFCTRKSYCTSLGLHSVDWVSHEHVYLLFPGFPVYWEAFKVCIVNFLTSNWKLSKFSNDKSFLWKETIIYSLNNVMGSMGIVNVVDEITCRSATNLPLATIQSNPHIFYSSNKVEMVT